MNRVNASQDEVLTIRLLALNEDVEAAVDLINNGLAFLEKINLANGSYYLPFTLLSLGYEHLMKDIICLGHYQKNGEFPCSKVLLDPGHELVRLKQIILDEYMESCFFGTRAGREDKDLIADNMKLNKLLGILTDFAGATQRYYHLNVVTSSVPLHEWEKETAIAQWTREEMQEVIRAAGPDWKSKTLKGDPYKIITPANAKILGLFNRALARILIRQGKEAGRFTGLVADFLHYEPSDVGL